MTQYSRVVADSICDSRTLSELWFFYESRITDNQSAEQTGLVGRPNHGEPHSVCDNPPSLSNNAEPY